jgi:hypothetical protein
MWRNKCFFQVRMWCFTFYIHLWPVYWLSLVQFYEAWDRRDHWIASSEVIVLYYKIFNNAASRWYHVASNDMMTKERWIGKNVEGSDPGIFQDTIPVLSALRDKKIMKNLNQGSRYPDRDSIRATCECKSEALPCAPACSVWKKLTQRRDGYTMFSAWLLSQILTCLRVETYPGCITASPRFLLACRRRRMWISV